MPMDRTKYPPDWTEISNRIRFERAGGRCEQCGAVHGDPHPETGSKVVLTVAHLGTPYPDGRPGNKANTFDCRDENLSALCQRCHLALDQDDHLRNSRKTRLLNREPWVKLPARVRTDPRLAALSAAEFRVWIGLICYAAERSQSGHIFDPDLYLLAIEVAGGDAAWLALCLERFEELRLISRDGEAIVADPLDLVAS